MSTLAILFLVGQAAATPSLTSNVCVATTVVAPGERPARGVPRFSAGETLDVQIRTQVRPVIEGDHLLRLKLLTPRGYHYQTITVPISMGSGPPADDTRREVERTTTRVVPGYPRPLAVQTLGSGPTRRGENRDAATARLPVAGTSISLGSLFGRWTVVPYLDDQTAPCGPARTFDIDE